MFQNKTTTMKKSFQNEIKKASKKMSKEISKKNKKRILQLRSAYTSRFIPIRGKCKTVSQNSGNVYYHDESNEACMVHVFKESEKIEKISPKKWTSEAHKKFTIMYGEQDKDGLGIVKPFVKTYAQSSKEQTLETAKKSKHCLNYTLAEDKIIIDYMTQSHKEVKDGTIREISLAKKSRIIAEKMVGRKPPNIVDRWKRDLKNKVVENEFKQLKLKLEEERLNHKNEIKQLKRKLELRKKFIRKIVVMEKEREDYKERLQKDSFNEDVLEMKRKMAAMKKEHEDYKERLQKERDDHISTKMQLEGGEKKKVKKNKKGKKFLHLHQDAVGGWRKKKVKKNKKGKDVEKVTEVVAEKAEKVAEWLEKYATRRLKWAAMKKEHEDYKERLQKEHDIKMRKKIKRGKM